MTLQRWRNRLVEELRRQGLPSNRVNRLVEELTEHALDVFSENQIMDAERNLESRLGTPEHLATVAKDQFKKSTFAGRHPVLTFFVGSVATLFVAVIGPLLVPFFAGEVVIGFLPSNGHRAAVSMNDGFLPCVSIFMRFVPFLLSTWLFVSLGYRSGQQKWSLLACCVIAASASVFVCQTDLECFGLNDGVVFHKRILFGLGYCWDFDFRQTIQAVVPLSLGLCMHFVFLARNHFKRLSIQ